MISSSTFLKKPRRDEAPPSDVRPGTPMEVGAGISQCLRVKGFCVITDSVPQKLMDQAAPELEDQDWERPAMLIQEGLLGPEGSHQISKLQEMAEDGTGAYDGLRGIDYIMRRLMEAVGTYQEEMGFRCNGRTPCVLHKAGDPDTEEAEMKDEDAMEWSSIFMSRKIMVLVFLGPGTGTLELKLYDDDANVTEITTVPGQLVVVRTDQLSFKFFSRSREACHVASSFLVQNDILRMHRNKQEEHITPVARELENWIDLRLKEIKEMEPDEPQWSDCTVPRNLIQAANRTWFKRQTTSVTGIATRQSVTWEPEVSFLGLLTGCDTIIEVPFVRWDHTEVYDPHPDSWQLNPPKTNCRHVGLIDGIDLFDNKQFGLGLAEVKGMDPSQRLVLECTYDALYRSGMRLNTLRNSTCGMYVGTGNSEWGSAEKAGDVGIYGATGGSPAIMAGRLSFCLGCKGASVAIDAEAASSLSCVYWAAESVEKKGSGFVQEYSCAIGVHLCLAKSWWPAHSAAGFLCPRGRCFTFDSSAGGHVRSEGVGAIVVRCRDTIVDGTKVDEENAVGTLVGGAMSNSGRCAGLSAPSGPTEQAVLVEACRKSGIMPFDVDAIECHGAGKLLSDAVEAASCAIALRPDRPGDSEHEMLSLFALKSQSGNCIEMSGLAALVKTIYSIRWGIATPNVHLNQLNPHLDLQNVPVLLSTEPLEQKIQAVFIGVSSHGFGGTHVHLHCYGSVDEDMRPPPEARPEEQKPRLSYWPGGGGDLGSMNRPRRGFFITGTWNNWEPEKMEDEGEGCYGYTLTLGENRWEQFQIRIDGSDMKVLHPQSYKATKGTEVFGPIRLEEVENDSTWFIDGRVSAALQNRAPEERVLALADRVENLGTVVPFGHEDRGLPGDKYRIRLHIAGKWRTVTWSKLETERSLLALEPPAGGAKYYVAGNWSGYSFEEMSPDASNPGLFVAEVTLKAATGNFQIVRNADWHQTIYPASPNASSEALGLGPDDRKVSLTWMITGAAFETYRIQFSRYWENDLERLEVSWSKIKRTL